MQELTCLQLASIAYVNPSRRLVQSKKKQKGKIKNMMVFDLYWLGIGLIPNLVYFIGFFATSCCFITKDSV